MSESTNALCCPRKISVVVVPGARTQSIETVGNTLKVRLRARAVEGQANEALIEALAEHFKVKRRQVTILSGHTSRRKIVQVTLGASSS